MGRSAPHKPGQSETTLVSQRFFITPRGRCTLQTCVCRSYAPASAAEVSPLQVCLYLWKTFPFFILRLFLAFLVKTGENCIH